ncbi:E3 ubiquitin protein ligase UPL2-like protein [Tanacetum coccineum]
MWTDDQQSGGSNASSIPSGLEDFLVSHLTRPTLEKASHQDNMDAQTKNKSGEFQESAGMLLETTADINDDSDQADALVSQESSGSGATLGETLRSLDVEIGSADGQDDGGERQGPRRINASLGNTSVSLRDASLHSVTEFSKNPSQDTNQIDHAHDETCDGVAGSALIDPAFFDALPEELRPKVNQAWTGLPRGVKFDPLDHEIIWHLLTKSGVSGFQPHPFIDEFIPTVEKDDVISYTHLQKLPGFVVVPKGSLFQLNVKANVGLPPDAIYNIVTDPDNKRVFKNIQVLVDEGSRQVVEIKQAAILRFLCWSGTISVHVLVDHNEKITLSSLLLWNIDTLQTKSTPEEHQYVITDVQFRPNSTQFATASFDNGAVGDGVDDQEKIDQLKGYPNGSSAYITKVELLAVKNLIGAYLNGINNAIFVHVNYAARMVLGSSNLMSGEEFNFYELPVKFARTYTLNLDPTTRALKGFGYCEFEFVEGVLRALRLLSKLSIDGQELMLWLNILSTDFGYERFSVLAAFETETASADDSMQQLPSFDADIATKQTAAEDAVESLELWNMTENKRMTVQAHDTIISALAQSHVTE